MNNGEHLIDIQNVYQEFDTTEALRNINMYVRKNEFLTLLGPSGCGKTTLLRILAGFITPTRGDVLFAGKSIVGTPPYKRRVNTVFQRYALFPHLNVFENVAFGLKIKKCDRETVKRKVSEMLKLVGLSGYDKRYSDSLSGGQQQRVAIARALVNEPEVLLLDEPLGALDLKFRKEMQLELKKMQRTLGITFIYVTHDQEEALTMSDTIAVMNEGEVQQIGTPEMIYNEPENSFVADFIGESNILKGIMREDFNAEFSGRVFKCVDKGFKPDEPIEVVVRPEDIEIVPSGKGMITGTVSSVIFMGVHFEMRIQTEDGFEWLAHNTKYYAPGSGVGLNIDPDSIHIMRLWA
jgi:spermidine/putrescine transport system ATP-binding protein